MMNRLACVTLFSVCSIVPASAFAQRINLPPVTRAELPNGIRVILMEYRRAPSFTIAAQFPGGESRDPSGKSGTASLTAEMLRKGTERRSAQQIAEEIDFLGGSLGSAAGDDRLSVSLSVLSKDAGQGLDLFADVIKNPTFPQEEIDRERQLMIAALESLPEDPGSVAARVANQTAFAGHPYGAAPTISSVKAISREDIRRFYRQCVIPDRMIVVAVGDFKTAEMLQALKSRFADWPRANPQMAAVARPAAGSVRRILIDKPDAVQSQVRWVRQAIPRNHPDYYAAQLADTILGGGFTSRLVEEIRVNRGLTYGIGSSFDHALVGGTFGVTTFTKVETTRALITAVHNVLKSAAQSGLTSAEIAKGKQFMAGLFAIQVQTPEAIAGQLADMAFYGLPDRYLATYIERIRAVTPEQLRRIARQYFAPESFSLVIVAPAEKVKTQLETFGKFDVTPVGEIGK